MAARTGRAILSTMKRIRRLVRERQIEFSDHALDEMDNDNLTLEHVRTGCFTGLYMPDTRMTRVVQDM